MSSTKRVPLLDDLASIADQGERRVPSHVPVIVALLGAFLAWRASAGSPPSQWAFLQAIGAALGGLIAAGGLGVLILRWGKGGSSSPFSRSKPWLGALLAAATAAGSVVDLLSGRSALVLLCGSVFLSLLYWDRPKYLFLLLGSATLAAAVAALSAGAVPPGAIVSGGAASIEAFSAVEQFALVVSAAGLGVAAALTIRSVVAPGVERLRSLERENRELWDLSFRDGLTGLYNRRFAQETGQKLFARASRYHERFYALMIDIDHFKRVNDDVSHAAGDEVLAGIAAILQSCVRSSDVAARYGGEEFVVFLLEAEPETAQFIANRIRDDVAAHRFEIVPWQVTISVGVAGREEGESLDQLVDRADKHLYVAKRSGRNRVAGY